MSRKRTTYSADFKAKIVLEVIEGEKTAKIGLNRTTMQELDRTQKRSLTGQ